MQIVRLRGGGVLCLAPVLVGLVLDGPGTDSHFLSPRDGRAECVGTCPSQNSRRTYALCWRQARCGETTTGSWRSVPTSCWRMVTCASRVSTPSSAKTSTLPFPAWAAARANCLGCVLSSAQHCSARVMHLCSVWGWCVKCMVVSN